MQNIQDPWQTSVWPWYVIGYAVFLNLNELVHIKAEDIKVEEGFMSIQTPQSKADHLHKRGSKY